MSKFELKTPDAPASFKQGITIRRLTGNDIRGQSLTMQQAHDIISEAMAAGAVKMPFVPAGAVNVERVSYSQIMKEATKAANDAGKAWLASAEPMYIVTSPSGTDLGYPPMLDVCGFVWIEVTDRRSSFARWLAKQQQGDSSRAIVPHHYRGRQEMGLKEACERAALDVFTSHFIGNLRIFSRID
jgi:hypothetical protein